MKIVTKKVSRKFVEMAPEEMAYQMYLASLVGGWDIDGDGINTTVSCDPDTIEVNEKTGAVCFELMDQGEKEA